MRKQFQGISDLDGFVVLRSRSWQSLGIHRRSRRQDRKGVGARPVAPASSFRGTTAWRAWPASRPSGPGGTSPWMLLVAAICALPDGDVIVHTDPRAQHDEILEHHAP